MKLYSRILILSLLPLLATSLFLTLRLSALVESKQKELELTRRLSLAGIESRILTARRRALDTVRVLSVSSETYRAMLSGDADFLSRWGAAFLGADLDMVIFSTAGGEVLARAHDESRRGDSYADHPAFVAMSSGGLASYEGVVEAGGTYYLAVGVPVRARAGRIVGYVVAGRSVSRAFLDELSAEAEVDLLFPYPTAEAGAEASWLPGPFLDPALGDAGRLGLRYRPSSLADELSLTMRSSIAIALAALIGMPVFLAIFLFLYVKPYGVLTAFLVDYSQHRIGLRELSEACGALAGRGSTDAGRIASAVSAMALRLQEYLELVERKNSELERLSRRDTLTGIPNRLALDEFLSMEWKRSVRYGTPLAVIMADIDHFKKVNDELGHQEGDAVLVAVSRVLSERTRNTDICGRWGGEEFLIICPHTDAAGAASLAEDMRRAVGTVSASDGRTMGASFGVASLQAEEPAHSLVSRADRALYRAKEKGRDRVVAA